MTYYIFDGRITTSTSSTVPDGAIELTELEYQVTRLVDRNGFYAVKAAATRAKELLEQ